jgi:DnaJ family protein C protein 3
VATVTRMLYKIFWVLFLPLVVASEDFLTVYKRAMTNVAKQRSKEAIRDLTLALELKPDFSQALRERGRLYMRLGQLPLALKDFENFEATNPMDVEGKELKGSLKEAMNAIQQLNQVKDTELLELLNIIIQTSPESVDHRLKRAEWYELQGNDEMAKNDYM